MSAIKNLGNGKQAYRMVLEEGIELTGSIVTQGSDGNDVLRTTESGRNVVIDTIINAESISSGANIYRNIAYEGESEMWALITIDKDEWYARASLGPFTATGNISGKCLYPKVDSTDTTVATSPAFPHRSLFVYDGSYGSIGEAYNFRQINDVRIFVANTDAEVATATVKIMRVWR